MDAIIGNTGGAAGVIAYVKAKRAHVEGMLSYANTRGAGSYGTDASRVYSIAGQNYYDRATICHPKVLTKQTNAVSQRTASAVLPVGVHDGPDQHHPRQTRPLDFDPYKGDGYKMELRLRHEDQDLSAQHGPGVRTRRRTASGWPRTTSW